MTAKKNFLLCLLVLGFHFCSAQIEVAHLSVKEFKAIGFSSFLNFSIPLSEANYVTVEGGLQYFKYSDDEEVGLFPISLGYRYTVNRSGTGLYLEPSAGYNFGGTTIGVYENDSPVSDGNGDWLYEKVAGPTAGLALGYLLEPGGKIQLNLALRYQRGFGPTPTNMFAFRVTHAFTFGRNNDY